MKKKLFILAPNDRFNYGDLLFSKILSAYFKDKVDEIILCSTTEADLRKKGGDLVCSHRVLNSANSTEHNILLIAGGECLFANWYDIIKYVDRTYYRVFCFLRKTRIHNRLTQTVVRNGLSFLIRKQYGFISKYPFTIGKNEISSFSHIIYNSVGGSWLQKTRGFLSNDSNKRIINSCDYISVRDKITCDILSEINIDSVIVPDSAILMSDYFKESFLSLNSVDLEELGLESNNYIFFQINRTTLSDYKVDVVNMLRKLLLESYTILFCPIGTAYGHSDDIALIELYNLLDTKQIKLIKEPGVWDIMNLIRNAKCYIGTSLHGVITSMSYNTPFIGYKTKKLQSYLNQWDSTNGQLYYTDDINVIPDMIGKVIDSKYDNSYQKELVYSSFNKMYSIICDER